MKKIFLIALVVSSLSILSIVSCTQTKNDETNTTDVGADTSGALLGEDESPTGADQGGSFPVVDTTGKETPNKAIE